jgi:hypothetical protein
VCSSEHIKGVLEFQRSRKRFPDTLKESIALVISSKPWRRVHEIHQVNRPANVPEEATEIME